MFTRELVLAPQVVQVEFALAPAINALNSLHLTGQVERLSGLGDWVVRTASAFTPAERSIELVVSDALALSVNDALPMDEYPDFPAFLRDWNAADPVDLRDRLFDYVLRLPEIYPKCWTTDAPVPRADEALSSLEAYTAFMRNFDESAATDEAIFAEAYRLLRQPERLQREVAAFLTHLWEIGGLRDEWTRAEPMLIESVSAFQKQAYRNLTAIEAIRAVTGRDMSGFDDWQQTNIDRVLFIPSPHMGPYIAGMVRGTTFTILFGARPPKGASTASPELSRAELLIRLNALADDTRLHILELLTRHDELCAQDIIERLDLSQSSASRHLSQLSAAGFLTERRREVNKCYSLNHERAADVVRALRSFLTRH
jgi:ArsR family transcriptional regulator